MHQEDIKAAMRKAGWTQAMAADHLGVAKSSVAQVIAGSIRSARIQAFIATIIGKPVKEIWPNQIVLRRSREQIEAQRRAVA